MNSTVLNTLNGSGFVSEEKTLRKPWMHQIFVGLPALVYGTAFIHWELDDFFFFLVKIVIFITNICINELTV